MNIGRDERRRLGRRRPMLRLSKVLDVIAATLTALGGAALFIMMLLTVIDVFSRWAFNAPIRGVYDLVESTLVLTIFCGIPGVMLRQRQIVVDLTDHLLGVRWVSALRWIGTLLSLGFIVVLLRYMIPAGLDAYRFADRKPDFPVPLALLWAVMIACVAAAAAMLLFRLLRAQDDKEEPVE